MVDIIVQEVEEGQMMLEIVTLVKEKGLVDECKIELEKSISSITENLCNAKKVKKEHLLDTLEKRNVTSNLEDASLLTLITVVELSTIQYDEVTTTVTSIPIDDSSTETQSKEIATTNVEEDSTLKVTVYPQVLDHDTLPKFKEDDERIQPSNLPLSRNAAQVWLKRLDCFQKF